jgi:hypothetical protein
MFQNFKYKSQMGKVEEEICFSTWPRRIYSTDIPKTTSLLPTPVTLFVHFTSAFKRQFSAVFNM